METELRDIEEGTAFYRRLYYCTTVWVRSSEGTIGGEGLLCHELGNPSNTVRIKPRTIVKLAS